MSSTFLFEAKVRRGRIRKALGFMKIALIVIAVIIVLIILGAVGFYIFITHPKLVSHEEARKIEDSKDFTVGYDDWEKQELNLTMSDGYVLHGVYIHYEGSNKYVIITHGYTYNYEGSIKYAQVFRALGYNIYMYDIRHHGYNKKMYCSMGRNESRDVVEVYNHFRTKFGSDVEIGLHGESLGAASTIMALKGIKDANFVVADCGFSDFKSLAQYLASSWMHLPKWFFTFPVIVCVILHQFRLDKIRPIDSLAVNTTTPCLFIHGEDDNFIPKTHAEAFFAACRSKKQLVLFPKANHAESYVSDRKRYKDIVEQFLSEL